MLVKEKKDRKKRFLKNILNAIRKAPKPNFRVLIGDLNVLEPNHIPKYSFFRSWEYDFYNSLISSKMKDAFRSIHPNVKEYSWIGRTGNGYRYDHCFVSDNLVSRIEKCFYLHEPRNNKLSDHSAIITKLTL